MYFIYRILIPYFTISLSFSFYRIWSNLFVFLSKDVAVSNPLFLHASVAISFSGSFFISVFHSCGSIPFLLWFYFSAGHMQNNRNFIFWTTSFEQLAWIFLIIVTTTFIHRYLLTSYSQSLYLTKQIYDNA